MSEKIKTIEELSRRIAQLQYAKDEVTGHSFFETQREKQKINEELYPLLREFKRITGYDWFDLGH